MCTTKHIRGRGFRQHDRRLGYSEMRSQLLSAAFVFMASGTCVAQTQSLEEIFNSDEILKKAQGDIGGMDVAELRLFADSFAQCANSLSQNELIQNSCRVSRERYAIEYGSGRALDRLLSSVALVEMLIRSNDKLKKKPDTNMILRLSDVTPALKDTTNRVFYLLRPVNPN